MIEKSTQAPLYIGKSFDFEQRFYVHTRKYAKQGLEIDSIVLEIVEVESDWKERERYWIAWFREFCLIDNRHKGGNSFPNGMLIGIKHSEETKKKISVSHKGLRYSLSQETKSKIGKANKGKVVKQSTKDKARLSNLGKSRSDETRKRISDAQSKVNAKLHEIMLTRNVSWKEAKRMYHDFV